MSTGLSEVRGTDGVTVLTFDRAERLNSFTGHDYRDLREAMGRAVEDDATRVVLLTGAGRAFSAGADRSLLDGSAATDDRELASIEFGAMLDAIDTCDKPVLAAVNGVAVGIGCTVLLHCDLVLAAESARFRLPFTSLGIVPEAGSSALLPAQVRWSDAVWAMLSSEWIDARSAAAMGLVWRVAADAELIDESRWAAAALAALDPRSVAATKRLLVAGRADVTRAAIARETVEMRALFGRRPADGGELS